MAVMNPQQQSNRRKENAHTSQINMFELETHILANLLQRTHDNGQAPQKQVRVQVLEHRGDEWEMNGPARPLRPNAAATSQIRLHRSLQPMRTAGEHDLHTWSAPT